MVSQPADNYFALLQAASISHTGPDLAVQWTGLFDLKYQKFLLNLKPYLSSAEVAKINGAPYMSLDFNTSKGLLVMPLENQFYIGFYNKALFKKAGVSSVPTSWSELNAACTKLKAKGITPMIYGADTQALGAQFYPFYDFSYQMIGATLAEPVACPLHRKTALDLAEDRRADEQVGVPAEVRLHEQGRPHEDEHPRRVHQGSGGDDRRRQLGHSDPSKRARGRTSLRSFRRTQTASSTGRPVSG